MTNWNQPKNFQKRIGFWQQARQKFGQGKRPEQWRPPQKAAARPLTKKGASKDVAT